MKKKKIIGMKTSGLKPISRKSVELTKNPEENAHVIHMNVDTLHKNLDKVHKNLEELEELMADKKKTIRAK